jgi:hypothetical protein
MIPLRRRDHPRRAIDTLEPSRERLEPPIAGVFLVIVVPLAGEPKIIMRPPSRQDRQQRQAVMGLDEPESVVGREIAYPARFQHTVYLVEHGPGVGNVFVHLNAGNDVEPFVSERDVECIGDQELQIVIPVNRSGMGDGDIIDIDGGHRFEMPGMVMVHDTGGTADVEEIEGVEGPAAYFIQ